MFPRIIGFAGKANSGKDTAGKYLIDKYDYLHYYFAKPLKDGAKTMFNLSDEQVKNKEKCIEPWGRSPRQIYQLLGTDVARSIDINVWVKNAQMFLNDNPGKPIVITDVRFSNESYWIRNLGGLVVYISRDQELILDRGHASENGLSGKDVDVHIENNGTINALYENLHEKLGELKKDKVKV